MPPATGPFSSRLSPESLGFAGDEKIGWTRDVRGRGVRFRLLTTLEDLAHAERLQLDVFGVAERDLLSAVSLLTVPETGGAVIAAFLPEHADMAAGVLVGWGGFRGRPRVVSDFLAVRPQARNLGLAEQMKRLQAGIARARGFEEIVWTVDPLRAANARLNFGKLGAIARHYEIDRYGPTFAGELYGGLPSDRLHVTWEITTPRVVARLLGHGVEPDAPAHVGLAAFHPGKGGERASVALSPDIDALLAEDPASALDWRMTLRASLPQAFAEGFTITGFLSAAASGGPAYILTREREARG
jgi:predicted GNAT superfamily acetyltransferase